LQQQIMALTAGFIAAGQAQMLAPAGLNARRSGPAGLLPYLQRRRGTSPVPAVQVVTSR
jgi:hypothetical protein